MLYSTVCTAILLLLLFCSVTAAEREIYVSPNGNDSSNCSKGSQCTLDRGLSLASGLNSTKILATKGNYSLKTSHSFTKIATFGLFGTGTSREDVQIKHATQMLAYPLPSAKILPLKESSFSSVADGIEALLERKGNIQILRGQSSRLP